MSGRDTVAFDTGAGAKAANLQVDDLSDVIRSLDKKAQGEFSLRLLIAARSATELQAIAPSVHRVFVEARAQVMEETLGNLSAFYAIFPAMASSTSSRCGWQKTTMRVSRRSSRHISDMRTRTTSTMNT